MSSVCSAVTLHNSLTLLWPGITGLASGLEGNWASWVVWNSPLLSTVLSFIPFQVCSLSVKSVNRTYIFAHLLDYEIWNTPAKIGAQITVYQGLYMLIRRLNIQIRWCLNFSLFFFCSWWNVFVYSWDHMHLTTPYTSFCICLLVRTVWESLQIFAFQARLQITSVCLYSLQKISLFNHIFIH